MVQRLLAPSDALATGNATALPLPAASAGGDSLHELRVRIPMDLHRQLLSLKILRGRSLADTVALALDIYFAEHAAKKASPEAAIAEA